MDESESQHISGIHWANGCLYFLCIIYIDAVELIRESKKDEPMIKTIREKSGKYKIVFVLKGRIVQAHEFESLDKKEGDDIRWVHPYFGGWSKQDSSF